MELHFWHNFVNFLSYYRLTFCPAFFPFFLNDVAKYQCLPIVLFMVSSISSHKSWFFFFSSSILFFQLLTSNSTLSIFSAFSICKMEFDCARSREGLSLTVPITFIAIISSFPILGHTKNYKSNMYCMFFSFS